MEPLIASFATIVSLIGQFRSERGASEQNQFNDFIAWLSQSQHDEIAKNLELNTKATIGIKALLQQDRQVFLQYIERIDNAITAFASAFDGFSEVAKGLKPNSVLSKQALLILRQFKKAGASKLLDADSGSGPLYLFIDGAPGSVQLEVLEERFIEDDFGVLVDLGLLRTDFNSSGNTIYIFTRAALEVTNQDEELS